MLSGEIYYYWPLNSVDKIVSKTLHCIIYCVTNAVAVIYSRNIRMTEKRSVCFQSKQVKICRFLPLYSFITTIIYIFEDIF